MDFEQAYASHCSSRNSMLVSDSWDYNKYEVGLSDPYVCMSSSHTFVRKPKKALI